ncbi:amidase [Aquamicrobium sp.]|uniref:amidase n=1 Tax=Aquamicrobium sp. TaxID=1872579 RepID=UPI002584A0F4|nr:amidase [Aquamicrobium sp.]MCK9552651.1 amidase [Aquamicrobium sp.]
MHSLSDRPLNTLGIQEIQRGIEENRFTAKDVVRACLERIAQRDNDIRAWVMLDDREKLLEHSESLSNKGRLNGVPVGVKDVIDVQGMPTRMGARCYDTYRPPFDAGCVGLAKQQGAIVLGKTVTAEFAGTQPSGTRNPLNLLHTPGGSSSGSAAAVADFMVPLAFGTQTGGSVLRPASFCGVVGFKPSFGFYPVSGMKVAAHSFDTIGLIAREVQDIAIAHGAIADVPMPVAASAPPRIGVFRTHLWGSMEQGAAAAFDRAVLILSASGAGIVEIETPNGFSSITEQRAIINAYERARDLAGEWSVARDTFSPQSADVCERGFSIDGATYALARQAVENYRVYAGDALFSNVDLLISPTVYGEAPEGHAYAGNPQLQELWTMLHLPSLSLPAGKGSSGLPLGLQVIGQRFQDDALLSTALWIERKLQNSEMT